MTDAEVLRYMGLMGHPFAVTCEDKDGHRCSKGECNTEEMALKWAQEANNGKAYRKDAKHGWRLLASYPNESKAP